MGTQLSIFLIYICTITNNTSQMETQISIFLISSFLMQHLCWARPGQLSIERYDPVQLQSENRVAGLFHEWRVKHDKNYMHAEETMNRFEIFKRNLRYIVERNSNQTGFTIGLNRFADLTNEEFKEMYMGKLEKPVWIGLRKQKNTHLRSASVTHVPHSMDWRVMGVVTPVKNQLKCGCCWAFSATGAIEGVNAIKNGKLISLSEQQLLSCDTYNAGCNGGVMTLAFNWVMRNGGIDTQADYPYMGVRDACNITKRGKKAVKIDGYADVQQTDNDLLAAVAEQPVSVAIEGFSMDFQLYTGGIYEGHCSSDPEDINHGMLIVGYGSKEGKDYWIVKSSWSTEWGMDGYAYIRRNTSLPYGVCAINAEASYPIQTSASSLASSSTSTSTFAS